MLQTADANAADSAAGYVETADANAGAQPAANLQSQLNVRSGFSGTAGQRACSVVSAALYAGGMLGGSVGPDARSHSVMLQRTAGRRSLTSAENHQPQTDGIDAESEGPMINMRSVPRYNPRPAQQLYCARWGAD